MEFKRKIPIPRSDYALPALHFIIFHCGSPLLSPVQLNLWKIPEVKFTIRYPGPVQTNSTQPSPHIYSLVPNRGHLAHRLHDCLVVGQESNPIDCLQAHRVQLVVAGNTVGQVELNNLFNGEA